jgi:hypothetical protein
VAFNPYFLASRRFRWAGRLRRNFQSVIEGRDALVDVAFTNWERRVIYEARNVRQLNAISNFGPTITAMLIAFGADILRPNFQPPVEQHTHRDNANLYPYLDITEAWWRLAGQLQSPPGSTPQDMGVEVRMFFNTRGVFSHFTLTGVDFPENERIVAPMQRLILAAYNAFVSFFTGFFRNPFPPPRGFFTGVRDLLVRNYDLFQRSVQFFYMQRIRLALIELLYDLGNSDPIP